MMKYLVTLGGKRYEVTVEESSAVLEGVTVTAAAAPPPAPAQTTPAPPPVSAPSPTAATASSPAVGDGLPVKSPMPGAILSVKAEVGKQVRAGEVLLVLEAMKMENDIVAPKAGLVAQLLVREGDKVNTDDTLAVLQ